jgi:hypothetical protein
VRQSRGPPRKGFASFFQAEITLEKRKKEGTECQKDNKTLGELLREAVEKPGRMLEGYTAFHNRGYIQHCLKAEKEIPNHTTARISAPYGETGISRKTPSPC